MKVFKIDPTASCIFLRPFLHDQEFLKTPLNNTKQNKTKKKEKEKQRESFSVQTQSQPNEVRKLLNGKASLSLLRRPLRGKGMKCRLFVAFIETRRPTISW